MKSGGNDGGQGSKDAKEKTTVKQNQVAYLEEGAAAGLHRQSENAIELKKKRVLWNCEAAGK